MARAAASASAKDAGVAFYSKFGQKHPVPSPGSGDRVFYESLYKENPESNMALVWLIEHGVFSDEQTNKLKDRYETAKAAMKAMMVPSADTSWRAKAMAAKAASRAETEAATASASASSSSASAAALSANSKAGASIDEDGDDDDDDDDDDDVQPAPEDGDESDGDDEDSDE